MIGPARIGKYDIRRELGRGSMGVVYEGYDASIDRLVAIKVLRTDQPSTSPASELRSRFRREAQAAGRLSHPNIVAVYEYGEAESMPDGGLSAPFIAMEYVEGQPLKELLKSGTRFSTGEVVRIMEQIVDALEHAHSRGVVHRDIKPGNLIVLKSGQVKVADFGAVIGTLSYMSPEQFMGESVDRRTDIYSCGVVLYELLTGELPFTGSPITVMQRVLHEEPITPSILNQTLPVAWDQVILRALAKRAADRFQSAADFVAALRAAYQADGTTVLKRQDPPPGAVRVARPAALAAIAIASLVLGGLGVFALLSWAPGDAEADHRASAPSVATADPRARGTTMVTAEPLKGDMPPQSSDGSTGEAAIPQHRAGPASESVVTAAGSSQGQLGSDRGASISILSSRGTGSVYRHGERIDLEISTDRDVFLYCYLIDSTRKAIQFFPNGVQPSASVRGGAKLQIPGRFPFVLKATSSGMTETIACLAALRDPGRTVMAFDDAVRDAMSLRDAFASRVGEPVALGVFDVNVR
jgi:serine/threonine-protein kinase